MVIHVQKKICVFKKKIACKTATNVVDKKFMDNSW